MKAIIVEDEPLAIDNLKFYLKDFPINIVGSAFRINEAVKLIKKEKPDVVFLDINLSGECGFDLLDKVDMNFKLIFVTAYDEYAIRAFEVNALDYILKPLKKDRIKKTIGRLFEESNKEIHPNKYTMDDVIFLSGGKRACFIKVKNICYIEADSCYSKLYLCEGDTRVFSRTLKKWEELLPGKDFIRIHRSFLLNINFVSEIKKQNNGTYNALIKCTNSSVEISRRHASEIRNNLHL